MVFSQLFLSFALEYLKNLKKMCKCTEGKSCFKHKGWSHQMLLIDKLTDKENLFMTLFLSASSFYKIFTQVPKTFHRVAGRFLEAFSGFSLSFSC